MSERKGVIAAGNMLVDHVHQIVKWPEPGWLTEITRSERSPAARRSTFCSRSPKCAPACRFRRWA